MELVKKTFHKNRLNLLRLYDILGQNNLMPLEQYPLTYFLSNAVKGVAVLDFIVWLLAITHKQLPCGRTAKLYHIDYSGFFFFMGRPLSEMTHHAQKPTITTLLQNSSLHLGFRPLRKDGLPVI